MHEVRKICGRCQRKLKSQPWADLGFGRVCAGRMGINVSAAISAMNSNRIPLLENPKGAYDINLKRKPDGTPEVNVPHAIVHHSPDGFEWGYGGSGPAELALNILASMIGQEAAQRDGLYQKFKWDFIAVMPEDGGTIKATDVDVWLKENGVMGGD